MPELWNHCRAIILRASFSLPETCSAISCGSELATTTAFGRSFLYLGGRHVENSDYGVGSFDIDDEGVKEGVIGCSWVVVFIVFGRHIAKLGAGKVDPRDSPGGGA